MFKKIIAGVLVFGMSSLFAMSLSALNSASKAELMEINGIGEVKAAAIIKERRHGKFKSFDDLTRVEGVGEQIASNVKNGVKVGQEPKKVTKKRKTASKKTKTSKKDVEEKASKKAKKTKSKAKKSTKEKAEKKTKKRKIKTMDEKKKELKSKAKKTKTKKTKAKKTKKTKSKKKN